MLTTKLRESDRNGLVPINRGFFITAAVSLVLASRSRRSPSCRATSRTCPATSPAPPATRAVIAFVAVVIGIVLAVLIQQLTGYFTDTVRRPVKDVATTSLTGPATVILAGISLGLESAVYSALLIGVAVFGAFLLGGGSTFVALYAVALAGCGLLTTAGVIVAMDTFGPVSDNAQGIAEMSGDIDEKGARVLTDLDAVGNTTKAITKGIAIATAVLAATALFGSFNKAIGDASTALKGGRDQALGAAGNLTQLSFSLDLSQPNNLFGVIIGASVVFLFSGLAISAVGRAAGRVVFEVRDQFRDHPGIMDFSEKPDYARVVDICTKDSLRELATPGLLAIFAPITVGFLLGVGPLAGYLGRRDRRRRADGDVPGQLRWRVGQREEDGRGRRPRRQGHRGARGDRHRRHRRRPVQGHRRAVDQPADQGHEPGLGADRAGRRQADRGRELLARAAHPRGLVAFAIIATAVVVSKRRRVSMGDDAPARPRPRRSRRRSPDASVRTHIKLSRLARAMPRRGRDNFGHVARCPGCSLLCRDEVGQRASGQRSGTIAR